MKTYRIIPPYLDTIFQDRIVKGISIEINTTIGQSIITAESGDIVAIVPKEFLIIEEECDNL